MKWSPRPDETLLRSFFDGRVLTDLGVVRSLERVGVEVWLNGPTLEHSHAPAGP